MNRCLAMATVMGVVCGMAGELTAGVPGPGPGPGGPGWPGEFRTRHYMPHGREVRDLHDDVLRLFIGGLEYFFWEGMYYRRMADHYVVVEAPIGAVVTSLPPGVRPVIIDGVLYYSVNGVTYIPLANGYQVVPAPTVLVTTNSAIMAPATVAVPATVVSHVPIAMTADKEMFTVNIPNSQGTYTAVSLRRSGGGFVGPQGEFYTEFPRVEQLKIMYGK